MILASVPVAVTPRYECRRLVTLHAGCRCYARIALSIPDKNRNDKESQVKSKIALLAVVLASVLAGCTVYTPRAVIVDDGPGPYHCPPGQAKKGRC